MSKVMGEGPRIVRPPGFRLDLRGAFMRRTDWSDANLKLADFSGADLTNASLRGADLRQANLDGTILRGADLREAKNLTREQVSRAVIDESTLLPDYLANGEHPSPAE